VFNKKMAWEEAHRLFEIVMTLLRLLTKEAL
jgi:hypothetical protein